MDDRRDLHLLHADMEGSPNLIEGLEIILFVGMGISKHFPFFDGEADFLAKNYAGVIIDDILDCLSATT